MYNICQYFHNRRQYSYNDSNKVCSISAEHLHNAQYTILDQYLHNIHTIFEQYLHNICNICTIYEQYLFIYCTNITNIYLFLRIRKCRFYLPVLEFSFSVGQRNTHAQILFAQFIIQRFLNICSLIQDADSIS